MMRGFETITKLVHPLYKLQDDYLKLKAEFHKEVYALECKYEQSYKLIYDKGTLGDSANSAFNIEGSYFWLTAMKNAPMLAKIIQEDPLVCQLRVYDAGGIEFITIHKKMLQSIHTDDEPILKHLTDISVDVSESDPMAFTLQFHFAPNDYFTNTVLSKEFLLAEFAFDGPEIVACKGCDIDWKGGFSSRNANQDDYNIDVPTGVSFFDFFKSSEQLSVDEESSSEEDCEQHFGFLKNDFGIGNFIREQFVPRAVVYFTRDMITTESQLKTILDMVEDVEEEKEETDAGEVM